MSAGQQASQHLIRVLLVEDNPGDADLVMDGVETERHRPLEFHTCTTLAAACEAIEGDSFDIILLDLGLPDSQGVSTFQRMHSAAQGAPIMVLTGHDDLTTANKCIELGAHDYLAKGYVGNCLARAIYNTVARARAQSALAESHENVRCMVANNPDAILVMASDGIVRFANDAAEALFGPCVAQRVELELPNGSAQQVHISTIGGTVVTVEVRNEATMWYGEPAQVVTLRDVTEHVEAKARLEYLNQTLRVVRSIGQLTIHEKDPQRLIRGVCELLVETRGYGGAWIALGDTRETPTLFAQAGWGDATDLRSTSRAVCDWPKCCAALLSDGARYALLDPTLPCKDCRLSNAGRDCAVVVRLSHGEATIGILGVAFASALSADEEIMDLLLEVGDDLAFALHHLELARQRDRYAQIVANSTEAMALIDTNYTFLETNESYRRLLGEPSRELSSLPLEQVLGETFFRDTIKPNLDRCFGGETVLSFEIRRPGTDGTPRFLDAIYTPCSSSDGTVTAVAASIRDVTEQRKGERARLAVSRRAQQYLDIAAVMFVVVDLEGIVTLINRKGCDVLGYAQHEVVGRNWFDDFVTPETREVLRPVVTKLLSGDRDFTAHENSVLTKSGEQRLIDWNYTVVRNGDGVVVAHLGSGQDITDRRRAEDSLSEAQQRLSSIFLSTPDHLALLDREHRIQLANRPNPRAEQAFVANVPLHDSASPRDRKRIHRLLDRVLSEREIQRYDAAIDLPNGERVHFQSVAAPVIVRGEVVGTVVSSRDVTESIEAAGRIRFLSEMVEQTPDGIVCTDLDAKITYINPAAEELFGWTLEELRGEDIGILNAEPQGTLNAPTISKRLAQGEMKIFEGEGLNRRKDGSTFICQSKVAPIVDGPGQTIAYMHAQRDVSERKMLELSRAESLRETDALLQATQAVLVQADFSSAAQTLLEVCTRRIGARSGTLALRDQDMGYREIATVGSRPFPWQAGAAPSSRFRELRDSACNGQRVTFGHDLGFRKADDTAGAESTDFGNVLFAPLVVDTVCAGLLALADKSDGFENRDAASAGAFAEIAAVALREHRTDQALRSEKEKWQSLVSNAPDIVFTLDLDGVIQFINRTDTGRSVDDIVGTHFLDSLPKQSHQSAMDAFKHAMDSGLPKTYETMLDTRDGNKWYSTRIGPIKRDGRVIGATAIATDITESRRLQTHLAQSDRLASMGMLAAGIAHEINNPLTYVLYNLQSLAADLPLLTSAISDLKAALGQKKVAITLKNRVSAVAADQLGEILKQAQDAVEGACRVRDIVRELKTFTRVDEQVAVPVSVNDTIETACNMATNEIKYRARLVKEYGELPTVVANDGKLAQVFLNLLVNAAQAIEEGDVDNNEIRVRTWSEGALLKVEIADTGAGIPAASLEYLFDPFFTTKKIGAGSGLGLSICHNIVTAIGGTIQVDSEPGKGTRFIVQIPVATTPVPEVKADDIATPTEKAARGRFLIVDDERHIGEAVRRMVSTEHDAVAVTSATQAMELLGDDPAFDGVICDLMMPDVTGMDLHAWLAVEHPKLADQMIFVTGGAFTPKAREFLDRVSNPRLEKPFEPKNLKAWLRKRVST